MSFYAVRIGRSPGIYNSWREALEQVNGYKGSIYQKFTSESDAINFISKQRVIVKLREPKPPKLPEPPESPRSPEISRSPEIPRSPESPESPKSGPDISLVMNKYFQHDDYLQLPLHSTIVAYSDGSAINNGLPTARAGYGVFFANPDLDSISVPMRSGKLSNNMAELCAIRSAIEIAMDHVTPEITNMEIYTDSQYSIGVVTGDKHAKANVDVIRSIRDLLKAVPFKVNLNYVEAHTQRTTLHHVGNRIADMLQEKLVRLHSISRERRAIRTIWCEPHIKICANKIRTTRTIQFHFKCNTIAILIGVNSCSQ